MSHEIKVVITLKDSGGFVGVQAPNCDPIFTPFEGELEAFLGRIPELVQEARQRWDQNPRYPKCESPLPSQTAPPSRPARSTSHESTSQPRIF
jgi:hypothetical protein